MYLNLEYEKLNIHVTDKYLHIKQFFIHVLRSSSQTQIRESKQRNQQDTSIQGTIFFPLVLYPPQFTFVYSSWMRLSSISCSLDEKLPLCLISPPHQTHQWHTVYLSTEVHTNLKKMDVFSILFNTMEYILSLLKLSPPGCLFRPQTFNYSTYFGL